MSYGLISSKTATVMVESTPSRVARSGAVYERFASSWGRRWVPGRLTLTRLNLTLLPQSTGVAGARLEVDLRDVTQVEISAGRFGRVIGLRTEGHVIHLKGVASPQTFAKEIAVAVEDLRRSRVA